MLRPSLDRLISSEVGSCDKLRRGFEKLQLRLSPMRALLALSLLAVATCLNVASTTIRVHRAIRRSLTHLYQDDS